MRGPPAWGYGAIRIRFRLGNSETTKLVRGKSASNQIAGTFAYCASRWLGILYPDPPSSFAPCPSFESGGYSRVGFRSRHLPVNVSRVSRLNSMGSVNMTEHPAH